MKLCGGKSPGLISTHSNTVTLDYHTDNDGQSSGWSLDYSTHSEEEKANEQLNCNGLVAQQTSKLEKHRRA